MRKSELLAFGLAYLALSCLYLRLTPARFIGAVGPDHGDPLFILAILRWGAERAAHGFADFWNPTFFFPLRGVLALSDHLAGPSVAAALLAVAGFTPAAVYNSLLLAAFAGSALTAHWVFRRSGLSRAGAAFGAVAWSFSCFRWTSLSHLQILLALFVPLTLWSFDRWLAEPGPRTTLGFIGSYAGQLSGGSYLGYMIHLPLLALAAVRLKSSWRSILAQRALPWLALVVVAGVLLVSLFFLPYLVLGKSLGLKPTMHELAANMVKVVSYVSPGARTLYSPLLFDGRSEESGLWLGLIPIAVAGFGLVRFLVTRFDLGQRDWAAGLAIFCAALLALVAADLQFQWGGIVGRDALRDLRWTFRSTIFIVLVAFVLLFRRLRRRRIREKQEPDDLWWWGLLSGGLACFLISHVSFFTMLRSHLPGMESIRLPGRFMVFGSFAVCAFSGRGFEALLDQLRKRSRAAVSIAYGLFALMLVELTPRAEYFDWKPLASESEVPGVYRWLGESANVGAIVELPMLETWLEAERMYYWSIHRRPIVNGYSAYLPSTYLELRRDLLDLPSPPALGHLREIGVSHVVVHLDRMSRHERRRWRAGLAALESPPEPALTKVREAGWATVYEISARRRP